MIVQKEKFGKQLLVGTAYTALAKYLGLIVSLVVTGILSRMLLPADFAVVAIATVFIGFIALITGSGLSPAIVQYRELTNDDIENLYSITIYTGFFSAIVFFVTAPCIAFFYSDERLLTVCQILSLNILFSVVNIVPNALFFREKRFKVIAKRTICINFIGGFLSVIAAITGWGIYSLLIAPVVGSLFVYIVSMYYYPVKFHWKPGLTGAKKIFSFSIYQILFNILNYSYRNVDKLLIGKYMNMQLLGYYEKSYRLMMLPLENISNVINPVLHPLLSEYRTNIQAIYQKYIKLISFSAYLGFSCSSLLFFCAPEMIRLLFGNQWEASIPVFRILSLSVGIQIIQSSVGAVFQAADKVKVMFIAGSIIFLITFSAIMIGIYSNSLETLATCIVIAFYIAFLVYHYGLFKYVFHLPLFRLLQNLWRPFVVSIIVALILWILDSNLTVGENLLNLLIKGFTTLCVFVLLTIIGVSKFSIHNYWGNKYGTK